MLSGAYGPVLRRCCHHFSPLSQSGHRCCHTTAQGSAGLTSGGPTPSAELSAGGLRTLSSALALLALPVLPAVPLTPVNTPAQVSSTGEACDVDVGGSPLPTSLRWALRAHRNALSVAGSSAALLPESDVDGVGAWLRTRHDEDVILSWARRREVMQRQPYVVTTTQPDPSTHLEVSVATARHILSAPSADEANRRWRGYQEGQSAAADNARLLARSTSLPGRRPPRGAPTAPRTATQNPSVVPSCPATPVMFYWREFSSTGTFMGFAVPMAAVGDSNSENVLFDGRWPGQQPPPSPFWLPARLLRFLPHFAVPPPYASSRQLHRMNRSQRVRLNLFIAPMLSTSHLKRTRQRVLSTLQKVAELRQSSSGDSAVEARVDDLLAPLPKVLGESIGNTLRAHVVRAVNRPTQQEGEPACPSPTPPEGSPHADNDDNNADDVFMELLLGGTAQTTRGTADRSSVVLDHNHQASDDDVESTTGPSVFPALLDTFWARQGCKPDKLPYTMFFPSALYPYLATLFQQHREGYSQGASRQSVWWHRNEKSFARFPSLGDLLLVQGGLDNSLDLADALAMASRSVKAAQARRADEPAVSTDALYATTEQVLEDMLFAIACELGEMSGGEDSVLDEKGEKSPRRKAHYYAPFYRLQHTHHAHTRSLSLLGEAYVNASDLSTHGVIDSTVSALHGVPLGDDGAPLFAAILRTRVKLQLGDDTFVTGEALSTPSFSPATTVDASFNDAKRQSCQTQPAAQSRTTHDICPGDEAHAPTVSTASPHGQAGESMWLQRIHELQGYRTRRGTAVATLNFQSFRERRVAMQQRLTRCRLRYTSPYWLDADTLKERWGVEHVSGEAVLVHGRRLVNAEQTSDASRFTAVTCAPCLGHQVLTANGLYNCTWRSCQTLEALLQDVRRERGQFAAASALDTRLWVALDIVRAAQWEIPRNATVVEVDFGGLDITQSAREELVKLLASSAETQKDAAELRTLRFMHADDVVARDELTFLMTYKPTVLVDKVDDLTFTDAGYASWQRAVARLQALASVTTPCSVAPPTPVSPVRESKRRTRQRVPAPSTTPGDACVSTAHETARRAHAELLVEQQWVVAVATKKDAAVRFRRWKQATLMPHSRMALALVALRKARHDLNGSRQVWVAHTFAERESLVRVQGADTAPLVLRSFGQGGRVVHQVLRVTHWLDTTWPTPPDDTRVRTEQFKWVSLAF